MKTASNPFTVTRAVDFSDRDILGQWVDLPGAGCEHTAKPTSEMPMIILGGKGSGKTHLMRYLSTSTRFAGGETPAQLRDGRFLGIYLRCGGINASRFSGKGRTNDEWAAVFQYYMDLTLAELALRDAVRAIGPGSLNASEERRVCEAVLAEFTPARSEQIETIEALSGLLSFLRRTIDIEVNNCALTKALNVTIGATPSRLVFAVPASLASQVAALTDIRFLYLIDELENLSELQQVYVNSLVRENCAPCSFKLGSRLYGLKTYRTLSSDEELKEGSEYECLKLDEYFRSKGDSEFRRFVTSVCLHRLKNAGISPPTGANSDAASWFGEQFETRNPSEFLDEETAYVDRTESRTRPWMKRLHSHLVKALDSKSSVLAEEIVSVLSISNHPVVERVSLHIFYQEWSKQGPSLKAAARIAAAANDFLKSPTCKSTFKQSFDHWKLDMLAHIARDAQREVVVSGFGRLANLAFGLPRHLLILVKHAYSWSVFRGERPFTGGTISVESQRLAIADAAEWFFQDARMAGRDGDLLQSAISRLGELMKAIRYSDKPSETGLCVFTVPLDQVAEESRRILLLAEKWSLLSVTDGGRPHRNSYRLDTKFRLNPLLAVRWQLSTSVRGDLALDADEMDSILSGSRQEFDAIIQRRTAPMSGPYFGRRGSENPRLPGI